MNKLFTLTFLLLVSTAIFSFESNDENGYKIVNILDNKMFLSNNITNEINSLSGELSLSDNLQIYNTYKKDAASPFIINLFLGFGAGSFYQGDVAGGIVGLVGELACYGSLIYINLDAISRNPNLSFEEFALANIIIPITVIGIRLFEVIRPFFYSNEYNNKLRRALTPKHKLSAVLAPTVNNDNMGIMLGASIQI